MMPLTAGHIHSVAAAYPPLRLCELYGEALLPYYTEEMFAGSGIRPEEEGLWPTRLATEGS
ncbi:MAG: hypothetical protein MJ061_05340, partial [Mailhella sp.]|nr:hypothetical protein [Mailhella sp.]